MRQATIRNSAYGLGALALIISLIMSGLMLAPNSASAFWWPWGDHHKKAHAQQDDDDDMVTVTIKKYIDGEPATSANANNHSFAMTSSWNDPEGSGEGSGSYELSADNSYKAVTSEMNVGADYSTNEVLDGDIVSASCDGDHPYKFVGYSSGTSLQAAASAEVSGTAPSFTDLSANQYVIVWNETCDDDDDNGNATSTGNISGEVTGGQSEGGEGELEITSIDAEKTTAIANGEFADGWQYVFNITVPTDEPDLAMKFADWMHDNGEHSLSVANNMRISSEQADSNEAVTLTAANEYSSPNLYMTGDLDAEEDGLQVQVLVEVAVPSDTFNGTYSTDFGVRTLAH